MVKTNPLVFFVEGSLEFPRTPESSKLSEIVRKAGYRNYKIVDLTKEAKMARWL